ncbi:4Fe-4S binding protein, partial [Chloroflexota bacterium]
HLSALSMGLPRRDELLEMLKEHLTTTEAEVLLMLPTKVAPLQPVGIEKIAGKVNLPDKKLGEILESLVERGFLYSGKTEDGGNGYALQQVGFGFPQAFLWKGEDTPDSRNMANFVAKYFNRHVNLEAYGSSETKPFRYVPTEGTIDNAIQAVFPYHSMETVIEQANTFAVAHCACRMVMQLKGRGCDHPLEVCMKFDNMAEYIIERELGKEITREEAIEVIRKSEDAGLVHFVDNAINDIKHNCNCCGCSCWNVGSIKRRKIPRDSLMATYFMRETDKEECVGCGNCLDICPVDAITIDDNSAIIDEEWCIGCGLCVSRCPNGAAQLKFRADKMEQLPLPSFMKLHERLLKERRD